MRNTSVEDSGYYYCELMVRGKEPIIEEVTKLTGTVSIKNQLIILMKILLVTDFLLTNFLVTILLVKRKW